MPGSASFEPTGVAKLADAASAFGAHRYDRAGGTFESLPHVKVLSYHAVEGATPATARFEYVFDDSDPAADSGYPKDVSDVFGLDARSPYAVNEDDELVVIETDAEGTQTVVFDGFAEAPQADVGGGDSCTFTAVGVAKRLWDNVIEGATYRDADKPNDGAETETDLPTVFNPWHPTLRECRPNCTPDDHDVHQGQDDAHPVFIEAGKLDGDPQTKWTLGKFVRYLVWNYNGDEEWVENPVTPDGSSLDDFLQSIKPKSGQYMDPSDSNTYTRAPIPLQNVHASGKPWIEVMAEQLARYDFGLFVATDQDEAGLPRNRMVVYRKDGMDGAAPLDVWMPSSGSLADGLPDANGLSLALDARPVANEFRVETSEVEYEATFVLAPLFPIDGGDASNANTLAAFDRGDASFDAVNSRKYRWFGVDECGEGHCTETVQDASDKTPFDFAEVFGQDFGDGFDAEPKRLFAHRWRPGLMQLATLDSKSKRREAFLEISTDYTREYPAVFDKTYVSTWRKLGTGGWKLLKDRLGIEITADNPNAWRLPKSKADAASGVAGSQGDVIKLVERLALGDPEAEDQSTRPPIFRLTCCVKSDKCIDALAKKRDGSPGEWAIRRCVEAKDRFRRRVISKSSVLNPSDFSDADAVNQDDTRDAVAEAEALRAAHECPPLAGSITVPWVSHAYGVGDLVGSIGGREIDLTRAVGSEAGEGPRYPVIIGFDVSCQNPQRTVFKIGDRRAEPPREYAGE